MIREWRFIYSLIESISTAGGSQEEDILIILDALRLLYTVFDPWRTMGCWFIRELTELKKEAFEQMEEFGGLDEIESHLYYKGIAGYRIKRYVILTKEKESKISQFIEVDILSSLSSTQIQEVLRINEILNEGNSGQMQIEREKGGNKKKMIMTIKKELEKQIQLLISFRQYSSHNLLQQVFLINYNSSFKVTKFERLYKPTAKHLTGSLAWKWGTEWKQ
ncbi:MAG: hypothetical protein EZS28_040500 [Streblomastix strix]|uniref:Uncharacterized protein n=1 Tax=Streblomastix strix TaxID=222440 RepID=A0A5J4U153_9EUKA|nr:MAG: hypothetical protein EZS28_040500 [Streblomastix strix]